MAEKTLYPVQGVTRTHQIESQTARLRANVQAIAYAYEEIPNKFITINLDGSSVAAGNLAYSQDDKRGYFLSELKVHIGAEGQEYYLQKDAPGTSAGSYQFTTTCELAVNLQAGTFGDEPTTGIGGSFAIGQSITQDLSDFRTINESNGPLVQHVYRMAATADGTPYNEPKDLVDVSFKGAFEGAPLYRVPELAIANLGIPSQAIFVSHKPDAGDLRLTVDFDVTLLYVEKTFEVFAYKLETKEVHWRESFGFVVPASGVTGN